MPVEKLRIKQLPVSQIEQDVLMEALVLLDKMAPQIHPSEYSVEGRKKHVRAALMLRLELMRG